MIRALGWIDFHLLLLAAGGGVANAVAVTGNGVDWYERPAWLFAAGLGALVEWQIAFWWWEKYRHRRGGWLYVIINQFLVLALFGAGIVLGMEAQHLRAA
jgi:hypothetical protein